MTVWMNVAKIMTLPLVCLHEANQQILMYIRFVVIQDERL